MSTPLRYLPEEALSIKSLRTLPISLHAGNAPINYKVALIRLLTGTLNVRSNLDNIVIKQRVNYSQLLFSRNTRISTYTIKKSINPIKLKDLNSYIQNANTNLNHKFYKELFIEFSNYFFRKDQHNEIAAFIHIYRILESIAYCFPLIWASRAKDYEKTFNKLKAYFNDPKTGELTVFKRFLEDTISQPIRNTQVQFVINSVHPDWQQRYYCSIMGCIDQSDIISYTEYSEITVKCQCLTSLLIKIRNQYFHFLTGNGNNFNSENVVESNEFFRIMNEILVNWLAVIFFEVLDYEIYS